MSEELSPAERYSASRGRQSFPRLHDFSGSYSFPLDEYQVQACREVEEGRGVLVAAPTGAGKTVVGEFAVHLALAEGRKCFYTTPIKALSNQKYADLVERYGADNVGLLTGDNVVNSEAPVVVMTTEVLRNMLYSGSRTLLGLGYVVMDEVHYLADRDRGAVWEEVIIHLPESVQVISLSATVSNAEEFGEWLNTVRGDTSTIVEEKRPVPLFQHVMVGRRILDLFASSDVDAAAGFVKEGAPVNHELLRISRDDWAAGRLKDRRSPKGQRKGGAKQVGNGRRVWIPSRVDVVAQLERLGMLPAITFIFSRAGCDAAVSQCVAANTRLTTPAERDAIVAHVEEACRHLPADDRRVLGYHEFADAMSRGVAAHHAGLLPVFKRCVEELFQAGLVKVVFATETLALGINMPARTVVIEKLSKWNGETHADLTPGQYTQLTGRAGRRGLDIEGHAVVLWQPGINPGEVAGLASTRTYPLRSSFRPSYNMAVNLVHQFGRERSRELLEQSFAQFQADRAVVGLARQLRKAQDALEGYTEAATCERGDFMEYAALRRQVSEAEKDSARRRRLEHRSEVVASLEALRRGDVVRVPTGKFAGWVVIIDPGVSADSEPRPLVVSADRQGRRLAMMDFPEPVRAQDRIRVPKGFNVRNVQARRQLADFLASRTKRMPETGGRVDRGTDPAAADEVSRLRKELKAHPCHTCPDREDHARWAERWFKLKRDADTLSRRVENRTHTVSRTFDRVCDVLTALEYLTGDIVTERGGHLRRLYNESDLVAAEALRSGVFDGLDPEELAAVLSALVFEARRSDDQSSPLLPPPVVKERIDELTRIWTDLEALERLHSLDFLRRPDVGFAWATNRWARGDDLDELLDATDMSAGDFVRWMKLLLDLCGQVADAADGDSPVRRNARKAGQLLKRGVVAYSALAD